MSMAERRLIKGFRVARGQRHRQLRRRAGRPHESVPEQIRLAPGRAAISFSSRGKETLPPILIAPCLLETRAYE